MYNAHKDKYKYKILKKILWLLYRPTVLQETIKLGVISSLNTDTFIIVLKILRKGGEEWEEGGGRRGGVGC